MPVLGEVAVNPILTNVALMFGGGEFIHQKLFPNLPVAEISGRFLDVDTAQEAQRIDQLERAELTRPVRLEYNVASTKTYSCMDRTIEHPIDDVTRAAYSNILDLRTSGARICAAKLMRAKENIVANLVNTAATYATANKATLAGVQQWSDYTNSTPIEDINTAILAVTLSSGFRPNKMWMGAPVWAKLAAHPDIVGILGSNAMKVVTMEQFATFFGFTEIAVGDAVYLSNKRGATVVRDWLWAKFAGLAYVNPAPAIMEQSFGYRCVFEDTQSGSYRDEPVKAEVVRTGEIADYVLLNAACGYLWTTAVA
jgi:hypothetical protein